MSLLDFALGDRAGTYLLAFCLLMTALAIISAIVDIPLRALHEAGYVRRRFIAKRLPAGISIGVGAATLLLAFAGATIQAYLASSPDELQAGSLILWAVTNIAFFAGLAFWGLSGPLTRHWGLNLVAFGLGVAALFLMLAAVLQLPFTTTGVLLSTSSRVAFAGIAGGILIAIGACLAAVLGLLAHIAGAVFVLAAEHRRHENSLISDWDAARRTTFRRFRARRVVAGSADEPPD